MRGLYIHVPFCVKKCSYCDFYSLPARLDSVESYVQAVIQEARKYVLPLPENHYSHSSKGWNPDVREIGLDGHGLQKCRPELGEGSPRLLSSVGDSSSRFVGTQKDNALFQTLYIGGGTPSLLGAKHLKELMDGLKKTLNLCSNRHCESTRVDKAISGTRGSPTPGLPRHSAPRNGTPEFMEATIEVNPESATDEFLTAAKEAGFNRVSFGVQSLSDDELRSVGRIHTAAQAISAIKLAQKLDYKAISADLIIGLPGQTWSTLRKSLEKLVGLGIQHLSVYCLALEEGTPLAENPPFDLPSDDAQVELFEKARLLLKTLGYSHYEISNFALKGYECLHNLNYWRGGEYLGLGAAAASHLNGKRFKNKANLDAYLENPGGQTEYTEELKNEDKAAEEAMLRLRLLEEGLDTVELSDKFGSDNVKGIISRLDNMVQDGLLIREHKTYRLTPSRVMTSNPIFARVIAGVK
ncbi:MAG: radical SAM family heme chaperone HemW [Dehalococcoidales bacterium]|nr:radical SAM family heme chaperone HemW [Dehalococcoidales bacterium]